MKCSVYVHEYRRYMRHVSGVPWLIITTGSELDGFIDAFFTVTFNYNEL
jgi:hypothetical protein